MKKLTVLVMLTIFCAFVPNHIHAQSNVDCPNIEQLAKTSRKDKDELLHALKEIVPIIYVEGEYGELYSEWELITAVPFPQTLGQPNNEVYYGMAKNFCGQAVVNQSWLVRLYFPLWEGLSASALEGQIFLAKDKQDGWFVWFRYH